jgi:hypothetical protein
MTQCFGRIAINALNLMPEKILNNDISAITTFPAIRFVTKSEPREIATSKAIIKVALRVDGCI